MNAAPNILIVAKPWRGGLADYLTRAATRLLGEKNVTRIDTRPTCLVEATQCRKNKCAWRQRLRDRIATMAYDVAVFIHPLAQFHTLPNAHKHALWLVDDGSIDPAMAGAMGHVFLSDPGYEAELTARLAPGQYAGILPFACDPAMHRMQPRGNGRGMCFIANKDTKRSAYLQQFFQAGVDCKTYGNYFLNHPLFFRHPHAFRPCVTLENMGGVYARHALSLNIHAQVVRAGTNMRTFEAASYGIAQLVETRPGLDQLFVAGEEILTFVNAEEAIEKYEYFMRSPQDFAVMAQRAQKRAHAEHTYTHRLQQILARF